GTIWDWKGEEERRRVLGKCVGGEVVCVEVPNEVRGRVCGLCAGVPLLGRYLFSEVVTRGNAR
ncbi:hypothetical protein, partial [Porphyromonas levii]|uniref:hypothetical protein n=1 Tax=Porphyromonas levii TaxID=28114 RepID=UPI001B8C0A7B